MKSDIRLNYSILSEIEKSMKRYCESLSETEQSIKIVHEKLITQNEAEALTAIDLMYMDINTKTVAGIDLLEKLTASINNYASTMESIIEPIDYSTMIQIDRSDMNANIATMDVKLFKLFNMETVVNVTTAPLGVADPMSILHIAAEGNYNKIKNILRTTIPKYAELIGDEIAKVKKIADTVELYEEADDKLAKDLDTLYDEYSTWCEKFDTNAYHFIKSSAESFGENYFAFGEGVVDVGAFFLAVNISIRYPGYSPLWVRNALLDGGEALVGVVEVCKNPFLIVELFSQGASDGFDEDGAGFVVGNVTAEVMYCAMGAKIAELCKAGKIAKAVSLISKIESGESALKALEGLKVASKIKILNKVDDEVLSKLIVAMSKSDIDEMFGAMSVSKKLKYLGRLDDETLSNLIKSMSKSELDELFKTMDVSTKLKYLARLDDKTIEQVIKGMDQSEIDELLKSAEGQTDLVERVKAVQSDTNYFKKIFDNIGDDILDIMENEGGHTLDRHVGKSILVSYMVDGC